MDPRLYACGHVAEPDHFTFELIVEETILGPVPSQPCNGCDAVDHDGLDEAGRCADCAAS